MANRECKKMTHNVAKNWRKVVWQKKENYKPVKKVGQKVWSIKKNPQKF